MEAYETNRKPPTLYQDLSGLGGWLVLVQIGLYLTILMLLIQLFNETIPTIQSEEWELLTTKGAEYYDPLWQPLLTFEMTANALMLLLCGYCLYNLYRRKAILPKLMITFYAANLVVILIDYALLNQIALVKELELMTTDDIRDIIRTIITCAVWIPYFLRSERVKNTFIN